MKKVTVILGVVISMLLIQMNWSNGGEDIDYMPPDPDVYNGEEEKDYLKEDTKINVDFGNDQSYGAILSRVSGSVLAGLNDGGTKKVLLIPIAFTDVDFENEHDMAHFQAMGDRLREYYEVNSGYVEGVSGLSLDCVVMEPVYSDFEMAEYGRDNDETGAIDGQNGSISRLAAEAVEKLYANGVDLSEYDLDGDKVLDHVIIIHAGMGQESSLNEDLIWSHQYHVDEAVELGGMDIDSYTMVPETGQLGVFAHEFGHDLGLPDLYDTDGMTNGYTNGIGNWGLMGGGSWNHLPNQASGSMPSNLSGWCRLYLGWADVRVVTRDQMDVSISNNNSISELVKVYPRENIGSNEFFLVEYRRQVGFDAGLPGEGALVWHVDQDVIDATIDYNAVNTMEARLGIELEQADGNWDLWSLNNNGDAGDVFNEENNRNFALAPYGLNVSNASRTYTYVDLMNFDIEDTSCTFDVYVEKKSSVEKVTLLDPIDGAVVNINPNNVHPFLSWKPAPHAAVYVLELVDENGDLVVSRVLTPGERLVQYDGEKFSYEILTDIPLENNTSYQWRLAGVQEGMTQPIWSDWGLFTAEQYSGGQDLGFEAYETIQDPDDEWIFYFTDREGKRIVKLDYRTGLTSELTYEYMPECMYIHNEILYATLVHRDHSRYWWDDEQTGSYCMIDLEDFSKIEERDIALDPWDIIVSNDGYIVIPTGSGQHGNMFVYDGVTGEKTGAKFVGDKTNIEYNPVLNQVYAETTNSYPRDLESYRLEADGSISFIHDSPYHGTYRLSNEIEISPDGQYVFNQAGNVFACTSDRTTDLIHYGETAPYNDIIFDLDNNCFYLINDDYIYKYDYPSLDLIYQKRVNSINDKFYRVEDRMIGFTNEYVEGSTVLNGIEEEEVVQISFSLDGENGGRLMGATVGMRYAIGSYYNSKTNVRENDMKLSDAELAEFAESKKLYILTGNIITDIKDSHVLLIELNERDPEGDADFFAKAIWSEDTNQVYGFDEKIEYIHSGLDKWEAYPTDGFKSLYEGDLYVRFAANGRTLAGEAHKLELSDEYGLRNELGWQKDLESIQWIDDQTGYVLVEGGYLYKVNIETDVIEEIHLDVQLKDLIYHNNKLYGIEEVTEMDSGLMVPIASRIHEIELETGHYDRTLLASVEPDMYFAGGWLGELLLANRTTHSVYGYDLAYDTFSPHGHFVTGLDEDETIIFTSDTTGFTNLGKVYKIDGESMVYQKIGDLTLTGFVTDVYCDFPKNEYLVLTSDQKLLVYDRDMMLKREYDFDSELLDIEVSQGGYILTSKNESGYGVGIVETYAMPEVSLSFSGEHKNQLIGSTSMMEVSFGDKFFRVPYEDYLVRPELINGDQDVEIRYKSRTSLLESGVLVLDVEDGASMPELAADDEANTLEGLTGLMEYSSDGGRTWTSVEEVLPDLDGNVTLLVRLMGHDLTLPGEAVEYVFTQPVVVPNPGGGGSTVGGTPGGGSTGGTPPPVIPVIPPIVDEEIPEAKGFDVIEEVNLGINEDNFGNFLNVDLYDSFDIKVNTYNGSQVKRLSLNAQNLLLIGGHAYEFGVEGWIGQASTSINTLMDEISLEFSADLSGYSASEIEKIGIYKLVGEDWIYVGPVDADGKISIMTSETGVYGLMMGTRTFNDIENHWARHYIEVMAAKQITNGKGNNLFDPDNNITRAEYVALIVRALGLKSEKTVPMGYEDVAKSKWYYDVVSLAHEKGLISSNVSFDPEVDIVREDMMVIIVEALKLSGDFEGLDKAEVDQILEGFKDEGAIKSVNRQAVALAIKYGIISGRREDYLAIGETASRAETMVVVQRLLGIR